MGNCFCKQQKDKTEEASQKNNPVSAKQPKQEDGDVQVVTNIATVDRPRAGGNKCKSKRKQQKSEDQRARNMSGDKDSDEGATESSDSSSSSSSEEVQAELKSPKKSKLRLEQTVIKKKTIINATTYNKLGNNSTLNMTIINSTNEQMPRQPKDRENTGPDLPSWSPYSKESALEENSYQKTAIFGSGSPYGNFIDTSGCKIESVLELKEKVSASESVCKICFPFRGRPGFGTGFRVGIRPYIMTAAHVVTAIRDNGYRSLRQEDQNVQTVYWALQQPDVYAQFGYLSENHTSALNDKKYRFKPVVHFFNVKVDIAVLELEEETVPPARFRFQIPDVLQPFSFIGHSGGKPMEVNKVNIIVDINTETTKKDMDIVRRESEKHAKRPYEVDGNNVLHNEDRYLFHCQFSKGASGSPVVVVLGDGRVALVTVLLCGYPDWYYDENIADARKSGWHEEYCIEQGAKISSVFKFMQQENKTLCDEIFGEPLPDPDL